MTAATEPSTRDTLRRRGIVRSEWIKLRSVRSTWWISGALVLCLVGIGAQMSASASFDWLDTAPTQDGMQYAGVNALVTGTDVGVLAVIVLGVLAMAGEYTTGTIRSSLTAVPRRVPVVLTKALVFAALVGIVSAFSTAITIPISIGLLSGNGIDIRLDDPHYWRALAGSVVYLVLVGLIAFGIAAVLRSLVGGVATAIGVLLVLPIALGLVAGEGPQLWLRNLTLLLPFNLGRALMSHPGYSDFVYPGATLERTEGVWELEPWQGALGLVLWVLVLFVTATTLLRRRDV